MSRFLYLNLYSFLLVFAGALVLVLPFYKISLWIFVIQGVIALKLFAIAGKLFSTWNERKRKVDILVNRNRSEFRPDTFAVYMEAPCGRLVARYALSILHKSNEYRNLLKLKKPFWAQIKENCVPVKSSIYINQEALDALRSM